MRLQVSPVAPYSPLVAPRAATMTLGGHSESPPLRLRLGILQFQELRGSRRKAVVDRRRVSTAKVRPRRRAQSPLDYLKELAVRIG